MCRGNILTSKEFQVTKFRRVARDQERTSSAALGFRNRKKTGGRFASHRNLPILVKRSPLQGKGLGSPKKEPKACQWFEKGSSFKKRLWCAGDFPPPKNSRRPESDLLRGGLFKAIRGGF